MFPSFCVGYTRLFSTVPCKLVRIIGSGSLKSAFKVYSCDAVTNTVAQKTNMSLPVSFLNEVSGSNDEYMSVPSLSCKIKYAGNV